MLHSYVNKATKDHTITEEMKLWFHHVRLEANDERHPKIDDPDATPEDAQKSIDFAKALGEFLFVLDSYFLPAKPVKNWKSPTSSSKP